MADDNNASLTERFPILVSGAVGLVLSQVFNTIEQFFHCFTVEQLAGLNNLSGAVIGLAVMVWQFKNVWSKASVAKVLDKHSPGLTTAQAKTIADEGGPAS